MYDRVRLDYTSDVVADDRATIENCLTSTVARLGLFSYSHYDKESGAWSIDITAHDRTRMIELTDNQLVARLKSIADERGITIADMLREAGRS